MKSRRLSPQAGTTLLEIVVAMPIVLVALLMLVQILTAGTSLRGAAMEEWAASSAAQDVLEVMRGEDIADVVVLYNPDPFDDPFGPGTAPGATFGVPGLPPDPRDEDGIVGRVFLPVVNVGTEVAPVYELRENLDDESLGMPRDLNGDARIDDADHTEDYTTLPVAVEVRWWGRGGPRRITLYTQLTEYH